MQSCNVNSTEPSYLAERIGRALTAAELAKMLAVSSNHDIQASQTRPGPVIPNRQLRSF